MKEVEDFFNNLSDRWDEICTHDPEKLNYIIDHANINKGDKVLDIGCGTGVLEKYILLCAPEKIVGVDISEGMIRMAKMKYLTPITEFRHKDVMALKEETFDVALAYSVFPHFEEPEKLIAHVSTLLRKGGRFMICHSESRDIINGHHQKQAGKLSDALPPVEELKKIMSPFFDIDFTEDNEKLYIISGIKI